MSEQLSLLAEPEYKYKAERIFIGPCKEGERGARFEWWHCVYRNGNRILKFLQKETAVNYVRGMNDLSGRV